MSRFRRVRERLRKQAIAIEGRDLSGIHDGIIGLASAIVVCIDGSKSSLRAIAWGSGEARRLGRGLLILRLAGTKDGACRGLAAVSGAGYGLQSCFQGSPSDTEIFQILAEENTPENVRVIVAKNERSSFQEILAIAEGVQASMIVVGAHTRRWLPFRVSFERFLTRKVGSQVVVFVP